MPLTFRLVRMEELDQVLAVSGGGPIPPVPAAQYRAMLARKMFRPEWTWIAEGGGRIVARAVWWGRPDGTEPLVLDCLWVDDARTDRAEVAGGLLRTAQRQVVIPGVFRVVVPNGWQDDPAARAAVAWRRDAAAAAGLTHEVERLQWEWTPQIGVGEPDGRLTFAPEPDDDVMLAVFQRIGDGSLDDETRKNRARLGVDETARDEMDFYLHAPGRREWWRTAHTADGRLAGLAVPSATSENLNVGYLGVLPEFRGHGFARVILDEITRSHAARGAQRITATTDVTNFPMVSAFRQAGYRNIETLVMLSAP